MTDKHKSLSQVRRLAVQVPLFEPGDFESVVGYHRVASDKCAAIANARVYTLLEENAALRLANEAEANARFEMQKEINRITGELGSRTDERDRANEEVERLKQEMNLVVSDAGKGLLAELAALQREISEGQKAFAYKPDGVSECWSIVECKGHDTHEGILIRVKKLETT